MSEESTKDIPAKYEEILAKYEDLEIQFHTESLVSNIQILLIYTNTYEIRSKLRKAKRGISFENQRAKKSKQKAERGKLCIEIHVQGNDNLRSRIELTAS